MQRTTAVSSALTFNEVSFDLVQHETGEPWLRVGQIASALGYSDPRECRDLYARYADEFTDTMTALVKLPTAGGAQETRIFSLRGAHLLGMLARTEQAKAFRTWVLDVLERQPSAARALPAPGQAEDLAHLKRQNALLRELVGPQLMRDNPQWSKAARLYNLTGVGKLSFSECAQLMGIGLDTWRKLLVKLDALALIDYKPNAGQSAAGKAARQRAKELGVLSNNASAEHMRKMNAASRKAKAANKATSKKGSDHAA